MKNTPAAAEPRCSSRIAARNRSVVVVLVVAAAVAAAVHVNWFVMSAVTDFAQAFAVAGRFASVEIVAVAVVGAAVAVVAAIDPHSLPRALPTSTWGGTVSTFPFPGDDGVVEFLTFETSPSTPLVAMMSRFATECECFGSAVQWH